MAFRLTATRKAPNIPQVNDDPRSHTRALIAIIEILEIANRRTTDLMSSFVKVGELIDLGLIDLQGNTQSIVGVDLGTIANVGDLTAAAEGDFLRFRSGEWINDDLDLNDITQGMVTQRLTGFSFITADAEADLTDALQLLAGTNVTFDTSVPGQLTISASGGGGGGTVDYLQSGTGISVDATDPAHPIVNLDGTSIANLALAATALQSGAIIPASDVSGLATVATSGAYSDLSGAPTIPVNLDDLTDVATGGAVDGYVLTFQSGIWYAMPSAGGGGGGTVDTVVGTALQIDVDSTDPANPILSLASGVLAALVEALSAVQPGDLATVATTGAYADLTGKPTLPLAPLAPQTAYTATTVAVIGDAYKGVPMNVGSANDFEIPPNSSVNFDVGCVINIYQQGTGQTTIKAGVGVTLEYDSTGLYNRLRARRSMATIWQRATDVWVLSGDLQPV